MKTKILILFAIKIALFMNVNAQTCSGYLYPTTKGFVKVNCNNAKKIDIINIQGQSLISKTVVSASNTLIVGKLSAGIYLVRVTTSNNKVVSSKLVIE